MSIALLVLCALYPLTKHFVAGDEDIAENVETDLKRYVMEFDFKPAIFGSFSYDPVKQEFDVPTKTNKSRNDGDKNCDDSASKNTGKAVERSYKTDIRQRALDPTTKLKQETTAAPQINATHTSVHALGKGDIHLRASDDSKYLTRKNNMSRVLKNKHPQARQRLNNNADILQHPNRILKYNAEVTRPSSQGPWRRLAVNKKSVRILTRNTTSKRTLTNNKDGSRTKYPNTRRLKNTNLHFSLKSSKANNVSESQHQNSAREPILMSQNMNM